MALRPRGAELMPQIQNEVNEKQLQRLAMDTFRACSDIQDDAFDDMDDKKLQTSGSFQMSLTKHLTPLLKADLGNESGQTLARRSLKALFMCLEDNAAFAADFSGGTKETRAFHKRFKAACEPLKEMLVALEGKEADELPAAHTQLDVQTLIGGLSDDEGGANEWKEPEVDAEDPTGPLNPIDGGGDGSDGGGPNGPGGGGNGGPERGEEPGKREFAEKGKRAWEQMKEALTDQDTGVSVFQAAVNKGLIGIDSSFFNPDSDLPLDFNGLKYIFGALSVEFGGIEQKRQEATGDDRRIMDDLCFALFNASCTHLVPFVEEMIPLPSAPINEVTVLYPGQWARTFIRNSRNWWRSDIDSVGLAQRADAYELTGYHRTNGEVYTGPVSGDVRRVDVAKEALAAYYAATGKNLGTVQADLANPGGINDLFLKDLAEIRDEDIRMKIFRIGLDELTRVLKDIYGEGDCTDHPDKLKISAVDLEEHLGLPTQGIPAAEVFVSESNRLWDVINVDSGEEMASFAKPAASVDKIGIATDRLAKAHNRLVAMKAKLASIGEAFSTGNVAEYLNIAIDKIQSEYVYAAGKGVNTPTGLSAALKAFGDFVRTFAVNVPDSATVFDTQYTLLKEELKAAIFEVYAQLIEYQETQKAIPLNKDVLEKVTPFNVLPLKHLHTPFYLVLSQTSAAASVSDPHAVREYVLIGTNADGKLQRLPGCKFDAVLGMTTYNEDVTDVSELVIGGLMIADDRTIALPREELVMGLDGGVDREASTKADPPGASPIATAMGAAHTAAAFTHVGGEPGKAKDAERPTAVNPDAKYSAIAKFRDSITDNASIQYTTLNADEIAIFTGTHDGNEIGGRSAVAFFEAVKERRPELVMAIALDAMRMLIGPFKSILVPTEAVMEYMGVDADGAFAKKAKRFDYVRVSREGEKFKVVPLDHTERELAAFDFGLIDAEAENDFGHEMNGWKEVLNRVRAWELDGKLVRSEQGAGDYISGLVDNAVNTFAGYRDPISVLFEKVSAGENPEVPSRLGQFIARLRGSKAVPLTHQLACLVAGFELEIQRQVPLGVLCDMIPDLDDVVGEKVSREQMVRLVSTADGFELFNSDNNRIGDHVISKDLKMLVEEDVLAGVEPEMTRPPVRGNGLRNAAFAAVAALGVGGIGYTAYKIFGSGEESAEVEVIQPNSDLVAAKKLQEEFEAQAAIDADRIREINQNFRSRECRDVEECKDMAEELYVILDRSAEMSNEFNLHPGSKELSGRQKTFRVLSKNIDDSRDLMDEIEVAIKAQEERKAARKGTTLREDIASLSETGPAQTKTLGFLAWAALAGGSWIGSKRKTAWRENKPRRARSLMYGIGAALGIGLVSTNTEPVRALVDHSTDVAAMSAAMDSNAEAKEIHDGFDRLEEEMKKLEKSDKNPEDRIQLATKHLDTLNELYKNPAGEEIVETKIGMYTYTKKYVYDYLYIGFSDIKNSAQADIRAIDFVEISKTMQGEDKDVFDIRTRLAQATTDAELDEIISELDSKIAGLEVHKARLDGLKNRVPKYINAKNVGYEKARLVRRAESVLALAKEIKASAEKKKGTLVQVAGATRTTAATATTTPGGSTSAVERSASSTSGLLSDPASVDLDPRLGYVENTLWTTAYLSAGSCADDASRRQLLASKITNRGLTSDMNLVKTVLERQKSRKDSLKRFKQVKAIVGNYMSFPEDVTTFDELMKAHENDKVSDLLVAHVAAFDFTQKEIDKVFGSAALSGSAYVDCDTAWNY